MGKRKSATVRRAKPKEKLATSFDCPFCSNSKSIEVKINKKHMCGELHCRVCSVQYTVTATSLTEPIDVFSEWIDKCEEENFGPRESAEAQDGGLISAGGPAAEIGDEGYRQLKRGRLYQQSAGDVDEEDVDAEDEEADEHAAVVGDPGVDDDDDDEQAEEDDEEEEDDWLAAEDQPVEDEQLRDPAADGRGATADVSQAAGGDVLPEVEDQDEDMLEERLPDDAEFDEAALEAELEQQLADEETAAAAAAATDQPRDSTAEDDAIDDQQEEPLELSPRDLADVQAAEAEAEEAQLNMHDQQEYKKDDEEEDEKLMMELPPEEEQDGEDAEQEVFGETQQL